MTSTEKRKRADMLEEICRLLDDHCRSVAVRGERFWIAENGTVFRPCALDGEYALVTECGDSLEDAERLQLEDADIYELEDYDSADQLLHDLLAEVGQ